MARGQWVLWGLGAGPRESFSHQTGLEKLMLFFPETLAIVSDTGEPQGELTIEVQKGKYRDDQGILTHCLLVHASSRGFIDKSPCGSSLLGRVQLPCTTSSLRSPHPSPCVLSQDLQPLTYAGTRARPGGEDRARLTPPPVVFPWPHCTSLGQPSLGSISDSCLL